MADNQITKDVYKQYAHKIVSVLKNEEFYEQFKKRVDKGSSSFKLAKKRLLQDISIDWIATIEDVLPNLDTIVRNPRKFIVQEEDIVDVSLARSISTESVKFLAQHTNMISKVDKDGMVTPSKILNITKEESFEIYENRFIYTLLLKLKDFVTMRYDKIKKASATQDVLELDVESRFNLPSKKVIFRTEYFAQLSFDEVMRLDSETLTKIERVAKIDRIISDFLSSAFAKSMRNSAPVRPPIMRTNVILKEPNFKKALTLWQFIETYNATGGFSTSDEVEDYDIKSDSVEDLKNMVTLNTMLFESMYEQHETDMDMEDKEFGDFLRVGDMDFEKDEINRDEYAQKLDEEVENEDSDQKIEENVPEEEVHDKDLEEETPEDETELPDEDDGKPDVEEEEKDEDKEIEQDDAEERIVEVEIYKEMVPKADQEEIDLEPDAEKFDQHLYDVRKLYKRPDDDKLKQADITKVKDAIDRCLTSYRRIKQEELYERVREERIRQRKEDMAKRAAALKKLREQLDGEANTDETGSQDNKLQESQKRQKAKQVKKTKKTKKVPESKELQKQEKAPQEKQKDNIIEPISEIEQVLPEQNPTEQISAEQTPSEQIAQAQVAPKKKRTKKIDIVDENKVAVGGIRFKDGFNIDDPFRVPHFAKAGRVQEETEENAVSDNDLPLAEVQGDKVQSTDTQSAESQTESMQIAETQNEVSKITEDNNTSEGMDKSEENEEKSE